jgi:small-conductance mechanosensitive channel
MRDILSAMAKRDQRVLKTPQPSVFVESLTGAGLLLNMRLWAKHENIGELQRVIVEAAKTELESAGIETLQPQQVVRVIPPDSDPSRLLSTAEPYIE